MGKDKIYILQKGIVHLKYFGPGFSLDELCDKIHISKKTFYIYFKSKNEFLKKLLILIVDDWKLNAQIFLLSDTNLKNSFLAIITYHIEELISYNPNFLRVLRLKFPKESLIIDGYYQQLSNELLSMLLNAQKNNQVRKECNLKAFLQKEKIYFEHLLFKENIFQAKEDYLKLLNISLEVLLINKK